MLKCRKILLKWLKTSRLTEKIQNVFLLTLLTGCRTGEICAIAWDDIDLEMKTIFLRETKTGISRYVQLSNQTVIFLKHLIVQQNTYFKCDYKKSLSNKNTLPKELGYLEKVGQC